MSHKILTINPGSTSTKIAVFDGEEQVFKKNLKHSAEEVAKYEHISDQKLSTSPTKSPSAPKPSNVS